MPQVFQQTLWVGGTDAEGEGQEVAYATTWEEGPGAKGLGPSSFRALSGGEALYFAKRGRSPAKPRKRAIEGTRLLRWSGASNRIGSHRFG